MTANEMADLLIIVDALQGNVALTEAATMLRQQHAEIEALKERLEETRQLYIKQLALQKLSDISQEFESFDRTASHMADEYVSYCELTNDEIMEICDEVGRDLTKWGYFQIEFARAILAKACNLK